MEVNQVYIFIIISTSIIALFAVSILILYKISQQKIYDEIANRQKKEILHKQEMIENNINAQELERTRIARDLHDDISSKLNVMNLYVQLLKKEVQQNMNASYHLNNISSALYSSIERTREISHNLLPAAIEKFGFFYALENYCDQISKNSKIEVFINSSSSFYLQNRLDEIHLFRIFQELINNTMKHANADLIQIKSYQDDKGKTIEYKDNGIGISVNSSNGIGLDNINSRAHLIHAVISRPSTKKGVHFVFNFLKS